MTNTASAPVLLDRLQRLGVEVSLVGGRLRLDAPAGALTPELKEEVVSLKADMIELLSRTPVCCPPEPSPDCPKCRRPLGIHGACFRCRTRPCIDCGGNTGSPFIARCSAC